MKRLSNFLLIFGTTCAAALFIVGVLAGFGITVPDPYALIITLLFTAMATLLPGALIRAEVL